MAYFRTRIGLRNALQEEISGSSDKEAVLITLNRPIVFAQPVAFDRGSPPFYFSLRGLTRVIIKLLLLLLTYYSCRLVSRSRAILAELQSGV